MSYSGRFTNKDGQTPRKSNKKRIVLIVLIAVVALLLAVVLTAVLYVNGMMNLIRRPDDIGETLSQDKLNEFMGNTDGIDAPVDNPNEPTSETQTDPYQYGDRIVNIMLIGQDYRPGEEGHLSDTMILCSLNKETKTLSMISFMRDMYVNLYDYNGNQFGRNRINVTYALGYSWKGENGAFGTLDQTIENNFGVHIDYNIEVGFDAFQKVIDEIGGVSVELDDDEAKYMTDDADATRSFKAGSYELNGLEALTYARMRHASAADSDFNRTERQRKLIASVVDKCRTMNIAQLNSLLQVVLPEVLTDMTNTDITNLSLELFPMITQLKIESYRCPADGAYYGTMIDIAGIPSGVLVPDVDKNREWLTAITEADQAND